MMEVELTEQQNNAYQTILRRLRQPGSITTLAGYAGTGKTTLLRGIVDELIMSETPVVLGAPTGKAARRMSDVVGIHASTMHSLLYGKASDYLDEEGNRIVVFGEPHAPCADGDVVIIDEASMVGQELYEEFQSYMPEDSSILYVGDPAQLEPVKGTWGPNLRQPNCFLSEVHRQALGSPILEYATWIRGGRGNDWMNARFDADHGDIQLTNSLDSLVNWYLQTREESQDTVMLAYTHKVREELNRRVRSRLGLDKELISPGDVVVVRANNRMAGLVNGEILNVTGVRDDKTSDVLLLETQEYKHPIKVFKSLVNGDMGKYYDRTRGNRGNDVVIVWHAQCLTVHLSQGSEWDNVGFAWCRSVTAQQYRYPESSRRLLYTAVTRAAKRLVISDVG